MTNPTGDFLATADESKTNGRDFFDSLFGDHDERAARKRRMADQCRAAIARGDTYGWPPAMVDAVREGRF